MCSIPGFEAIFQSIIGSFKIISSTLRHVHVSTTKDHIYLIHKCYNTHMSCVNVVYTRILWEDYFHNHRVSNVILHIIVKQYNNNTKFYIVAKI